MQAIFHQATIDLAALRLIIEGVGLPDGRSITRHAQARATRHGRCAPHSVSARVVVSRLSTHSLLDRTDAIATVQLPINRRSSRREKDPDDFFRGLLAALRRQVDATLKPVLSDKAFHDFDLDRAIALVVDMATPVA
ncbi:MAG: hypothetical protein ACKOYJ_01235 [Planctomycetia bacterium]